jgi:hypothetical protein
MEESWRLGVWHTSVILAMVGNQLPEQKGQEVWLKKKNGGHHP